MATVPNPKKDTIYIDVDDEITSVIEKVQDSPSKIIALVLPKRASVFQSVVNMKLLKRTADNSKKHIVLITSEMGILPLAGAVGIHVAKTAQSKPVVPASPTMNDQPISIDEDDTETADQEVPLDKAAAVGDLAGLPPTDEEDTIEVDDEEPAKPAEAATKDAKSKPGRNKRLQVPDFSKFRMRLILAVVALLVLGAGAAYAFIIMPKAKVTITTNNVNVNSSLTLTGSASAKTVDTKESIVPIKVKDFKKTDSQKVTATGKKDVGTKASGTVTMTLSDCPDSLTIPQGTAVSAGSLSFITQDSIMLLGSTKAGKCNNDSDATATVKVVAQNAGDQYNLSARSYSVAGASNVTASGLAMSGGTSKLITVVAQSDIDGAKQKILDANSVTSNQSVADQLKTDGFIPLTETLKIADPLVVATPNVGDEATDVTVNVTTTYTMTGAQQDAVKQLVEADINKKIDTKAQKILNNGLDKAVYHVTKSSSGQITFTAQATGKAGVQQDADEIKKAVAGKKRGEVQSLLQSRPGVKDVTVEYSPAWVFKTPTSTSKITVIFQQADGSTTSGQ